jgi:hypothetical protein
MVDITSEEKFAQVFAQNRASGAFLNHTTSGSPCVKKAPTAVLPIVFSQSVAGS